MTTEYPKHAHEYFGEFQWNPPTHEWVQHPEYSAVGRFKEIENNVWNHVEYKE